MYTCSAVTVHTFVVCVMFYKRMGKDAPTIPPETLKQPNRRKSSVPSLSECFLVVRVFSPGLSLFLYVTVLLNVCDDYSSCVLF